MSAYGPKADQLGASATGPNMAVFEQDKSASPESAQAEWIAHLVLLALAAKRAIEQIIEIAAANPGSAALATRATPANSLNHLL